MKKQKKVRKIFGGLVKLPEDKRDIKYEKVFGAIKLPTEDFIVAEPLEIKDQRDTDKCTAYAVCAGSEPQEETLLDPDWQFAQIKRLTGEYTSWGADLRSACKSGQDYGSIEKSKVLTPKVDEGELRNWKHWDLVNEINAKFHKKQTYLSIKGNNTFNAIRQALWNGREKKQLVMTGMLWRPEWTSAAKGIIPEDYLEDRGFGHAFVFIGQKNIDGKLYLVTQLSNGKEIGDKGLFYFSEKVVNKEAVYGNFVFVDVSKEVAQIYNETKWRWVAILKVLFRKILKYDTH